MPEEFSERNWTILVERVGNGKCTPFLGAGACWGTLPLGRDIARELADEFRYPFEDKDNLVRVAQYVAVQYDPSIPKERILQKFAGVGPPDFREPDEPHGLLAHLPLPIYLTTNYDDFMSQALIRRHRDVRQGLCRWNDVLDRSVPELPADYHPTVANPLVFHLHGHGDPDSLVLTEDDYLRFLERLARGPGLLPACIRAALTSTTLLFIGYSLADWNFRVILRSLRDDAQYRGFAVLLKPRGDEETRENARRYLERYYGRLDLTIYWGTAREFCGELRERFEAGGSP